MHLSEEDQENLLHLSFLRLYSICRFDLTMGKQIHNKE